PADVGTSPKKTRRVETVSKEALPPMDEARTRVAGQHICCVSKGYGFGTRAMTLPRWAWTVVSGTYPGSFLSSAIPAIPRWTTQRGHLAVSMIVLLLC